MDRQARITLAKTLCDQHECSEKVRLIHFDQIVNRHWNPHPPAAFLKWWKTHPEHNINPALAFNSRCYLDQFKAAT